VKQCTIAVNTVINCSFSTVAHNSQCVCTCGLHVAWPCRSVAVSKISRHSSRSYALCRADHRPRFCCFRSFSIVRGLQSFGSVEGPLVVLIWIWTDDVAEESQTPGRDRLGDRRLSGTGANYLVDDVGCEGNLQNVSNAPLIERIKSLAGLHRHIPSHYLLWSDLITF